MRQVPAIMHARWMSGEYIGDARPIGRVTIQRPNIALRRTPENLFSTLAFGGGTTPKELPNVESIEWQRGIDVDVSTCNISLHNTEPLPIGAQVTPDLDRPGWFTYNRGSSTFSGRWGHEVNEWSRMLMPDNILRTYEGYGCDPEAFPDDDPNLLLTGVWMIDDVDYAHDGKISVACRDVGRILIDQIAFPPVVPFKSGFVTKDLPDGAYAYPVSFQGENSPSIDEIGSAEVRSSTSRLGMTYRSSSNAPYTGDGAVFGHYPRDAFDDDDSTHWLSIGNARPDQGYSFEWIEGAVKKQRVSSVRFQSRYTGHTAYLCLYVDEQGWVGSRKVPYDPNHPASAPNGADTMYHSTQVVTSTGWTEFNFEGVSNVTRVRVTFGNLQDSGLGTYRYRAGVRRLEAHGGASGGRVSVEDDFRIQYDIQNVVLDADQPPFPWGPSYPSATLSGTWRLTFNGQRTSAIQWNAGATQVKSALEGLSNVDEVSVTGNGTSGSPFMVSFVGEKVRGKKHPLMLIEHHDLRHNHSTTRVYRASDLPTIRTIHFEDKNYDDYCADEQTEIMTKRGWLRWDEVLIGDESLAIDPSTGIASWQVIESVYRKRWDERPMISMESQVHSSLTTPDHRWLVTDQAGRRHWRTTEALRTGHRIPVAAPVELPIAAKYEDAFVELVAWFWTEGWISGEYGNACIAQSEAVNPVHTARIRAVLTSLFGEPGRMLRGRGAMWNESQRADGVVTFRLSKPVKDALLEVAFDKVVAPEFLSALTAPQLELFIERSIDADGWRTTKGRVGISQRDERRARSFEMALALAGRPSRTRQSGDGMWQVNLLRHAVTMPQSAQVEEVAYSGHVWCPTLKHSNWLARRNGSVYFTGNTDIVKLLCAWGGFYWPEGATMQRADGSFDSYPFDSGDPAMPIAGHGRVWGDFQQSGTRGPAPIPADVFDKKPLMDGIAYVRDILGYLFYVDETGGAVFRPPNIYRVGNLHRTMGSLSGTRTSQMYTLDERQILVGLTAQLTGRNVRERTFVSNTTGTIGHMAAGWNPNPVGLRRVGGWTDQNFESAEECRVMAEMIALRQLFTYRSDNVTISGFPGIQVDDQVRIFERTTSEGYIHYIKGVSSSLNHQSGEYTYQLETHWLGEQPFEKWIFDPAQLSAETQRFLRGLYA